MTGTAGAPWWLLAAVAISAAAGNAMNDFFDADIDRLNKPGRPIPSGAVTPRSVVMLVVVLLLMLIVPLLFLDTISILWIIGWIVLLFVYSAKLKRIYLAGNLLVSLVAASTFCIGSYAGGLMSAGAVPAALTFLFVLGRELVKDCEDVRGDRACGAKTVPIVSGERNALKAASILFAALLVGFPAPFVAGIYGELYGIVMLSTVVPILVASIILAVRGKSLGTVSFLLKSGMFFGIVAFYLSGIRL
jgi:geranylgeranylglycerol-phosphate geranylgeranyltransferase